MLITDPKILSVYLKDIRKQKQISQSKVAEQIGLRQATISDFEANSEKATIETLFKIVASLGYEIHLEPRPNRIEMEGDEW